MDVSGIEPEAFRMQIERDTTTPYTRIYILFYFNAFIFIYNRSYINIVFFKNPTYKYYLKKLKNKFLEWKRIAEEEKKNG